MLRVIAMVNGDLLLQSEFVWTQNEAFIKDGHLFGCIHPSVNCLSICNYYPCPCNTPYSMMLTPPCFTIGMVLNRWCVQFSPHQTREPFSTCCLYDIICLSLICSFCLATLRQRLDLWSSADGSWSDRFFHLCTGLLGPFKSDCCVLYYFPEQDPCFLASFWLYRQL